MAAAAVAVAAAAAAEAAEREEAEAAVAEAAAAAAAPGAAWTLAWVSCWRLGPSSFAGSGGGRRGGRSSGTGTGGGRVGKGGGGGGGSERDREPRLKGPARMRSLTGRASASLSSVAARIAPPPAAVDEGDARAAGGPPPPFPLTRESERARTRFPSHPLPSPPPLSSLSPSLTLFLKGVTRNLPLARLRLKPVAAPWQEEPLTLPEKKRGRGEGEKTPPPSPFRHTTGKAGRCSSANPRRPQRKDDGGAAPIAVRLACCVQGVAGIEKVERNAGRLERLRGTCGRGESAGWGD